jgi:hypothetical protein
MRATHSGLYHLPRPSSTPAKQPSKPPCWLGRWRGEDATPVAHHSQHRDIAQAGSSGGHSSVHPSTWCMRACIPTGWDGPPLCMCHTTHNPQRCAMGRSTRHSLCDTLPHPPTTHTLMMFGGHVRCDDPHNAFAALDAGARQLLIVVQTCRDRGHVFHAPGTTATSTTTSCRQPCRAWAAAPT